MDLKYKKAQPITHILDFIFLFIIFMKYIFTSNLMYMILVYLHYFYDICNLENIYLYKRDFGVVLVIASLSNIQIIYILQLVFPSNKLILFSWSLKV